MAQFPSLPLFTDAYLADTRHLTAQQHGAYLLLLMMAWRSPDCAIPDDDVTLARWASMDLRAWKNNRDVILAFWRPFIAEDGKQKWRQLRLLDERKHAERVHSKNVEAGRTSALKRKERGSTGVATEPQPKSNPQTQTHKEEDKSSSPSVSPKPTKARKDANPRTSLSQFLENTGGLPPAEWGAYPRIEHGWPIERINATWRAFHRYWTSPDCPKPLKRDWRGTWENWCDREAKDSRGSRQAGGGSGSNLAAAVNGFVARRAGVPGQDGAPDVPSGSEAGTNSGHGGMYLEDGSIAF
jgi:uncharacterized protein YdaU (DUF1376 family)